MWKMKNNQLLLFVLGFLIQLLAIGQNSLSLQDAITIGLENNFQIKLAREELKIAALDNQIGNAGFLPSVDANGSYNRTVENTALSFADGSSVNRNKALSTNFNAGVGANWVIFDGTKMFVTKDKLAELENIASLTVSLNINNRIAEIINSFTAIIAEMKALELYKEQLEVSKTRLELSKTKLKLGASSNLESLQAEVDANADRTAVINQEVRIKQGKARLNRLMAREVGLEFTLNDSIGVNKTLKKDSLMSLLKDNPNLSIFEKDIAVAVLEKKESFADRLPTVALIGQYNYNEGTSEAGFVRSNLANGWNYGATVAIPIFNGNEKNRKEQQSKIRITQSKLSYEQELAIRQEELIINYDRYEANLKQLEFEEKNVELANKNLKFALENYRLGGISSMELRDVQFSTLQAQERLVALKYTTKLAETELLRLTNQLIQAY